MNDPLSVLIVEDSEDDALLVMEELREGGYDPTFERVENREALESALHNGDWDIIIADYRLPNFSGIDALEVVQGRGTICPFIIVSGQISEETAVSAMKSGASDYVLKDNLARLVPAVRRELREAEVRRQRDEVAEVLRVERERSRRELEQALERERQYSLLLQRALLPGTPKLSEGYSVAAEYVPVYASYKIGGDFYDVFLVGDCKAALLIGDVAGKGLEAAAMAATTRSTIHAFVHETCSPAEALERANSVLYPREPGLESFVTVFLAILDICGGEVIYSSAGHPPQVICHADGSIEMLRIGQLPLAVLEKQRFEEHHAGLGPGDKLIMYTDGISEARRDSDMLDLEGVMDLLAQHARLPANELAQTLLASATDWAGGKLQDDAAVVITERLG